MVKWIINGCLAVTVWACIICAVIGEGWQVALAVFLASFRYGFLLPCWTPSNDRPLPRC